MSMRVGLVGNGHWARSPTRPACSSEPSVELSGIWGRDSAKTAALAAELGTTGYDDVEEMFAAVDAVAFSVPPQVQAELAVRAARAGKHLLLEKPIAVSVAEADRLADAVAEAGVASVVFFTARFDAGQRQWLEQVAQRSDWDGAVGLWLGSAFAAGSPFDTPWRHEKGGLWDVGPHALAMLTGALGEIAEITARPGRRDLVHLILRHDGGASSSYAVSIDTPEAASQVSLTVWGPAGRIGAADRCSDPSQALATAARELAAAAQLPVPEPSLRRAAGPFGGPAAGRGRASARPAAPPPPSMPAMRWSCSARPGSGKGTQGQRLAERFGVPHIASGTCCVPRSGTDRTRPALPAIWTRAGWCPTSWSSTWYCPGAGSGGGRRLRPGRLSPLGRAGGQAEVLAADSTGPQRVIFLAVPERLLAAVAGSGPPSRPQRRHAGVITDRLRSSRPTRPLVDHYRARGLLREVAADRPADEVTRRSSRCWRTLGLAPDRHRIGL